MKVCEKYRALFDEIKEKQEKEQQNFEADKKECRCLKTSEKIRQILNSFPAATPPAPNHKPYPVNVDGLCISPYCTHPQIFTNDKTDAILQTHCQKAEDVEIKKGGPVSGVLSSFMHLVQVSVTATALAIYYILYVYMHFIYCMLRSALYFHHADGPMKITIGVVTVTTLVIAATLVQRIERLIDPVAKPEYLN